ncbi:SUMF1/EgtB/PvdO family nonheme iron enzyme [Cesiribacter sp. SM1]|uniref:formylglycine-generating enzyme family protein n=1 Tax=Cesiribacter sp. SM1 TaxID=2861196 RepID=UPI001CD76EB6|nr:SUMF1/EgtB/PvdO family nonheme iron enzyme [Cesiribacter sp. SM1]
MEFELIEPGSMVVGRVELECPSPPDTREVDASVRWTEEDFKRCEELARRDSRPGFLVTINKPYYIGKYEVTQGQWKKVMGTNPSFFQESRVKGNADQHPVEGVSWEQAQAFIRKLNALDTAAVYRLPTEFEWEYAARAGADKLLSWAETKEQAWIQDTNKGSTQPVGKMKPNPWGLYDTIGNVWEWVEDYYNGKVYASPVPPDSGEVHVLKGGSFISDVVNATYFFHAGGPGNGYDVGFRLVRETK